MDQILQELQEIKAVLGNVVTKEDAKAFLTKDDARSFATKDDVNQIRQETKAEFAKWAEYIVTEVGNSNADILDEIDKQKADRDDVTYLAGKVNKLEKKLAS